MINKQDESNMRMSTEFIDLARQKAYTAGGTFDRILTDVVAYRRAHSLDVKFPTRANPLQHDDATLEYEFTKLAVVFATIQVEGPSLEDRRDAIEALKERFPASEVDEIVTEYELLKNSFDAARPAELPKSGSGRDWTM